MGGGLAPLRSVAMASTLVALACSRCRREHDPTRLQGRCSCGGTLLARYRMGPVPVSDVRRRPGGALRYEEILPLSGAPVSLGEPETPLLPLARISERWGVETYLKDDGGLPGGTFKARGAVIGLSRAVELGATAIVMPSAGNAGGAWALYAARAGIPITVTMARSAPEINRLEVEAAGGSVVLVDRTIADAGRRAAEIAAESGAFLAATFAEPYRVEGKKTAWLETFDQLGRLEGSDRFRFPRTIVAPVGGGVAAVAAAKAAEEAVAMGWAEGEPARLLGAQAARCAPIARAFERGDTDVEAWEADDLTVAAGLRVPAPSEGALVLEVIRASAGRVEAVDEEDIRPAIRTLASLEGAFVCPEAAAGFAAADRLAAAGEIEGPVVIYSTGSGVKYASML